MENHEMFINFDNYTGKGTSLVQFGLIEYYKLEINICFIIFDSNISRVKACYFPFYMIKHNTVALTKFKPFYSVQVYTHTQSQRD
jgi:hypothetical protein